MAHPYQDCVLLFGDSLTQRMDVPGSLAQRMNEVYSRKLDILNRGFGGYNTAMVGPLFEYIFAKKEDADKVPRIRLVTIWLGTNDAVLPPMPQHLPLSTFESNMHYFLSSLTSTDSPYAIADTPISIILITPGPCALGQLPPHKREALTRERFNEFRQAVLEMAREWKAKGEDEGRGWKVGVVDFWDALIGAAGGDGEELDPYHLDGVHLSSKAYEVLWNEIERVIKVDFKGRGLDFDDLDDLPQRAAWSDTVDPTRPSSVVEKMALPESR